MKRILLASALLAWAGPAMAQSSPELPSLDLSNTGSASGLRI
jgi:hypothetical protein